MTAAQGKRCREGVYRCQPGDQTDVMKLITSFIAKCYRGVQKIKFKCVTKCIAFRKQTMLCIQRALHLCVGLACARVVRLHVPGGPAGCSMSAPQAFSRQGGGCAFAVQSHRPSCAYVGCHVPATTAGGQRERGKGREVAREEAERERERQRGSRERVRVQNNGPPGRRGADVARRQTCPRPSPRFPDDVEM